MVVAGQALAYVLVLAYMYMMVDARMRIGRIFWRRCIGTGRRRPRFMWLIGVALSIALQVLAQPAADAEESSHRLFFRTPAEAWALTIFGITLAPLMEEMFFRGFLYPVLARRIGVHGAAFLSPRFCFALLHSSQLMFSWGPVLVIFLVGMVITMVRAYKNSVAAGCDPHRLQRNDFGAHVRGDGWVPAFGETESVEKQLHVVSSQLQVIRNLLIVNTAPA